MIEIDDATFQAMRADAARRDAPRFAAWWRGTPLPAASPDYLHRLWSYAEGQARELGIEDDADGRISLYAAAFGLMGDMDGIQFLQVSDILFLSEDVDARLARIMAVARDGPRADAASPPR